MHVAVHEQVAGQYRSDVIDDTNKVTFVFPLKVRQRRKPGMGAAAVELVVERAAAAQHAFEDLGGDAACREALRVRRWFGGIHAFLSHEIPPSGRSN